MDTFAASKEERKDFVVGGEKYKCKYKYKYKFKYKYKYKGHLALMR